MSLQLRNLQEVPEKPVLLPSSLYLIALESLPTNDTKTVGGQTATGIFCYLFKNNLQITLKSLMISTSKGHTVSQKMKAGNCVQWNSRNPSKHLLFK